ncbi:hypothetical protein [Exiguobacterium sp. KRL4]|uniref:hypothetical protein n=1 Tax=Exiguobacterium sp. KRL4 TaxID=1914536 RepID=UPI0013729DE1|nr:hypothetical protein [Exiguobacterium sp. KRL4]
MTKPPEMVHRQLNEIADFSNPQLLAGAADNVFIGEVITEVSSRRPDGFPETQYAVQVKKNLKGTLNGDITVNQLGGFEKDAAGHRVLVLYNEDALLKKGQPYMFATRYLKSEKWHTAFSTHGTVELKSANETNLSVQQMTQALQSPIVPEALKNKTNGTMQYPSESVKK